MTKFTLIDAKQVLIASFVATLFFLVIRAGQPFEINKTLGIVITVLVIILSNPKPRNKNLNIYSTEIVLTYSAVAILSVGFDLVDLNTVAFGLLNGTGFNLNVFGSAAIVSFWLALPVAVIYNKENLDDYLSRIFTRKR